METQAWNYEKFIFFAYITYSIKKSSLGILLFLFLYLLHSLSVFTLLVRIHLSALLALIRCLEQTCLDSSLQSVKLIGSLFLTELKNGCCKLMFLPTKELRLLVLLQWNYYRFIHAIALFLNLKFLCSIEIHLIMFIFLLALFKNFRFAFFSGEVLFGNQKFTIDV